MEAVSLVSTQLGSVIPRHSTILAHARGRLLSLNKISIHFSFDFHSSDLLSLLAALPRPIRVFEDTAIGKTLSVFFATSI